MKIMIASDIHGSEKYCGEMIDAYKAEGAERLLLLGDILYHGPRNDLPTGYNPKAVIEMLNNFEDEILCVRGNCDSEVDDMVLNFSIMAEFCVLFTETHLIYACHGHVNLPKLKQGDIVLSGHTHVPLWECKNDIYYFNPGSVSIPKNDSERGYMTYDSGHFIWKTLGGKIINEIG